MEFTKRMFWYVKNRERFVMWINCYELMLLRYDCVIAFSFYNKYFTVTFFGKLVADWLLSLVLLIMAIRSLILTRSTNDPGTSENQARWTVKICGHCKLKGNPGFFKLPNARTKFLFPFLSWTLHCYSPFSQLPNFSNKFLFSLKVREFRVQLLSPNFEFRNYSSSWCLLLVPEVVD